MINEHYKMAGVLTEKRRTSDENGKHRVLSKCSSKMKLEAPIGKKTLAGSLSSDEAMRNYTKPCDPKIKMKMMGLIPRNRAKETSEGVQEFIKHVSTIIESRNPFKEEGVCSWPRENIKNSNSAVIDSVQFNGVARKTLDMDSVQDIATEKNRSNTEKVTKNVLNKIKRKEKLNSVSSLKKEAIVKGKIKRPKSASKKGEPRERKSEKESPLHQLRVESKLIKKTITGKENQDAKFSVKTPLSTLSRGVSPRERISTRETISREKVSTRDKASVRERISIAPLQSPVKRRRPSEIPLRKNRTDLTSKPKPLSTVLRKTTKDVDREASVVLFPEKPGSPLQELQMTINVDLSSAEISIIGERIEPVEQSLFEEMNDSTKLERCYKRSNIFDASSKDVTEEKPSSAKKTIDLEKVKTSSFTVLATNSKALNRLESLHKKNVLSKEKALMGKTSLQKIKSNKSFNSLKGKGLKKSILSRVSSKGSKMTLKKKIKKMKKQPDQESDSSLLDCKKDKERSRKAENPKPWSRKSENDKTDRDGKSEGQQQINKSSRGRSVPRTIVTPGGREDMETASTIPIISKSELDYQKQDKEKYVTTSPMNREASEHDELISYMEEHKAEIELHLDVLTEIPKTPPPTPNTTAAESLCGKMEEEVEEKEVPEAETEDGDEWSSKTVIFDDKFNFETCIWTAVEQEIEEEFDSVKTHENIETTICRPLPLCFTGIPLNTGKDEPPEKPEGPDLTTVKKRLTIDLSAHGATSKILEEGETPPAPSLKNEEGFTEESAVNKTSSAGNDAGKTGSKEGRCKSRKASSDLFSAEATEEPRKPRKICSPMKKKPHSRSGGVKGGRQKSLRSDAGDRPSPANSNVALQNKNKADTKVRSGLTKACKREEKLDVFEDASVIKLKRRNSEPNSFRGYIWKCADSVNPKDHKASVSSLTSSLRHLNTDEIDDFIFWEPVPQKMTSCWEMSLYHFKRPWSVLSCSVFRDNRKSSTPGLILENLRNGGTLSTRRYTVNQSEKVTHCKENPFDVEPSIAQKNIDIRNWLAALNFPTLPSTSADALTEGNFSTQVAVDRENLNKSQVNQKRRKVLPNLKFPDETSKKKSEEKEKCRKSTKWCDEEGLTQLVRRKSGGFVTREQYLNSEYSNHRPNVTVNFCVYSKSAEESVLADASDRNVSCEPRKYKSVEIASQPELSISATIINSGALVGDQIVEKTKRKEKPPEETTSGEKGENDFAKIVKREMNLVHSDVNIWKYLFIITIFIIISHYCYINSYMCRN